MGAQTLSGHDLPIGTHSPPCTLSHTQSLCMARTLSCTAPHTHSCTRCCTASHTLWCTPAWWLAGIVSVSQSCTPSHTLWCTPLSLFPCTLCPTGWHTLSYTVQTLSGGLSSQGGRVALLHTGVHLLID